MLPSIRHFARFLEEGGFPDRATNSVGKSIPSDGLFLPFAWYYRDKERFANGDGLDIGHDKFWKNAAHCVILHHRFQAIAERLQQSNIPVLLLKGIRIAQALYPSPGLRAMADLDILVRPRDLECACIAIEALGWRPEQKAADSPALKRWPGRDMGQVAEIAFRDPRGHLLEVHWHLVPYVWQRRLIHVGMDAVWREAVPLPSSVYAGGLELSPSHTLAYLCIHQALHGLAHLKGFLDIDLFVRKIQSNGGWDWDRLAACCREWRAGSAAFHALTFSRALFGTPVPAAVLQALDPGPVSRHAVSALLRPWDLLAGGYPCFGLRNPSFVNAALADRWRDLASLALRLVFPPPGWLQYRYGENASLPVHWRHIWGFVKRGR